MNDEVKQKYNRVLDNLINNDIIAESLVQQVLSKFKQEEKAATTHTVISELINAHSADRHNIFQAISQLYAFKQINFVADHITPEHLEFIRSLFFDYPDEVRSRLYEKHVLPFKRHDGNSEIIIFVAANPIDADLKPLVRVNNNIRHFEIAYGKLEDIDSLFSRIYQTENQFLKEIGDNLQDVEVVEDSSGIDEEALDAEINRSMLTNLVEGTLVEATRMGASDIHFIPKANEITEIYFRVDGKLKLWHRQDKVKPEAFSAVVKDRSSNVDRFDRSMAQDGFIQRKIDGVHIRFRVSVLPIVSTEFYRKLESIVIRVLDDRKVIANIDDLGFQEQAKKDFLTAISQPQGMLILTGPTGSGKSTTLVAALNYIKDPSKCILTVEEPVEYMIQGARQIRLGPKLGFENAIRAILRHDPDIVMVGEMRDLKSASIGISMANTGHITLSTLHTNDAPSAISRLYKLGIETFLIANAIKMIIAQRLVRKLCPKCKEVDVKPDIDAAKRIGFSEEELSQTTIYKAIGCRECTSGYKGRITIMEGLLVTKEVKRIILESKDSIDEEAIRDAAAKRGMLTLRDSGKERIIRGLTSIEEVIAATTDI